MCLRFTIKQLRILYSHTYDQLAARARAERQRAARARVGHPAGAAGAAAAAAAFPGARRTADPARAPRQVRVLDAPHVCAACPALALAQGGALRAFPVRLGSLTAPACWPSAAGSRTACHPSFHTCPSSHTVGSGPNTGRKVRGVPGVPPVAKEAPFSSARHGSRSGPTDRARAARSRAAPRPASANAARAPPPCSPWPRRAAAASQPRRRRPCSFSD